ncbi:MAG: hypothetical protein LM585_03685 [Fervidicoccaceae archaeon]|nr:hypothetical protein [Fervidicoccaceae archaeon]
MLDKLSRGFFEELNEKLEKTLRSKAAKEIGDRDLLSRHVYRKVKEIVDFLAKRYYKFLNTREE